MKKALLGILALVQIIVGMLFLSASLSNVWADVNFVDEHKPGLWYGSGLDDNGNHASQARVKVGEYTTKEAPKPSVTQSTMNRTSH